jgi:hypothetical protein
LPAEGLAIGVVITTGLGVGLGFGAAEVCFGVFCAAVGVGLGDGVSTARFAQLTLLRTKIIARVQAIFFIQVTLNSIGVHILGASGHQGIATAIFTDSKQDIAGCQVINLPAFF